MFSDNEDLLNLKRFPQVIYGRDGTNISLNLKELWIFDTVLLNHLGVQLRPELIDRLCRESGLVIAHCYFCAQRSHLNNCFDNYSATLKLNSGFVTGVEEIGRRQKEKEIVSIPFQELREVLTGFFTSMLLRTTCGWHLQTYSHNNIVIAGQKKFISSFQSDNAEEWYKGEVGYLELSNNNSIEMRFAAMDCA
jgi:hypothetical protein